MRALLLVCLPALTFGMAACSTENGSNPSGPSLVSVELLEPSDSIALKRSMVDDAPRYFRKIEGGTLIASDMASPLIQILHPESCYFANDRVDAMLRSEHVNLRGAVISCTDLRER